MQACAALVPSAFGEAEAQFGGLVAYLESEETRAMTHSELERELEEKGRELMRMLLQAHLETRSPGAASEPVIDAEGQERKTQRLHERGLATVFGPVEVRRQGYGAEGAESLHPLDGELNLPRELYSHGLRRRAAEEVAKGSYDEAVATLARITGNTVHKRQVEELVVRAAQDFDAFYEQRSAQPETESESLLVLSFDGKGVVMRHEDLRPATRKAAQERQHKLSKRLSKGEKRNAKRMAAVAAVYTVAPFERTPEQVAGTLAPIHDVEPQKRPRPVAKRVWASLEKEPEQVVEQAFEEANRRDPGRKKRWVALVDGNCHQLQLVENLKQRPGVELTIVLDLIHVVEYLWKAASVFCPEATREREDWVGARLLKILQGHARHVAAGIRRSATLRGLGPVERKAADTAADYLLNHTAYLRYHEYLAAGLPIATGVIEGACRHLVKDRMELTGARWSLAGAEAVLRLRALRSSADFDDYWRFHEAQEYQRNHAALYAAGKVPSTRQPQAPSTKRKLRLVK
jgi:Uncharacterised protein family (UPF0236)